MLGGFFGQIERAIDLAVEDYAVGAAVVGGIFAVVRGGIGVGLGGRRCLSGGQAKRKKGECRLILLTFICIWTATGLSFSGSLVWSASSHMQSEEKRPM